MTQTARHSADTGLWPGKKDESAQHSERPGLERIVRLMPGLIYVYNHKTCANDYTNRCVGTQLGYGADEIRAMGGRLFMHLIHPDDYALTQAHMVQIGKLVGEQAATVEYRVVTKNGTLRWLRSVDTVFDRAPDGSVLRHIGCASDITAQKEAQLELARLNAQLETKVAQRTRDLAHLNAQLEARFDARTAELQDTVDELEQLTYIATHDLKVPVNNLSRLGLMLQSATPPLTPEQAEQVDWISACADQLRAKIQGLVLVAQIRLGSDLPYQKFGLRTAVEDTLRTMEMAAGRYVLPVSLDIADDIAVEFNRFELDSILSSLLDNAIKYAQPRRPLRIDLTARVTAGQVALSVADNGTGLDPQRDHKKVFGLFQRAHKLPPGSGISLYCAQRMLLRRGGALEMSGCRGVGAQFTILFPKEGKKP